MLDHVLIAAWKNEMESKLADLPGIASQPDSAAPSAGQRPAGSALEAEIRSLGPWFQNIELAGIRTAPEHFLGDYPSNKWSQIAPALPNDLSGASVLDVGCNAGFHSFECMRRGARRVVGVDMDPRYLAQARLAARVLNLAVEFRQATVYSLANDPEKFDYVFFLGLFYHLRYPLYALDLLVKKTRRLLIFQAMVRGEAGSLPASDYDFWDTTPFRQPGFPAMYFIEHAYAGDGTNWWIPNTGAVEGMMRSAGLRIEAHPESETWFCSPAAPLQGSYVWDREMSGRP